MSNEINALLPDNGEEIKPTFNRREVLKGTSIAAASAAFAAISTQARAASLPYTDTYGPLAPVADQATGLFLLSLPEGFTYTSFGWTGQTQADGLPTPTDHDGMAVVASKGNVVAWCVTMSCHRVKAQSVLHAAVAVSTMLPSMAAQPT